MLRSLLCGRTRRRQPTGLQAAARAFVAAEPAERVRARAGEGTWADFYALSMTAPGTGWSTVVQLATDHDPRRLRYSQHRHVPLDDDGSMAAALCAWLVAEESAALLVEALHAGVTSEELTAYLDGEPGFREAFTFILSLGGSESERTR